MAHAKNNPAPWIICPICKGEGKVDELGAIDPNSLDADEFEFYIEGGYDKGCANCAATGKVREDAPVNVVRFGSDGQRVQYADEDDASEHMLRMAEGWA